MYVLIVKVSNQLQGGGGFLGQISILKIGRRFLWILPRVTVYVAMIEEKEDWDKLIRPNR